MDNDTVEQGLEGPQVRALEVTALGRSAESVETAEPVAEPSAETLAPAIGVEVNVVAASGDASATDSSSDSGAKGADLKRGSRLPEGAQWHRMPQNEGEALKLLGLLREGVSLYRLDSEGNAEGPYTVCRAVNFTGERPPIGQTPIGENGVGVSFRNESLKREEVCVTVMTPTGPVLFQLMFNDRAPYSAIVVDRGLRVVD